MSLYPCYIIHCPCGMKHEITRSRQQIARDDTEYYPSPSWSVQDQMDFREWQAARRKGKQK